MPCRGGHPSAVAHGAFLRATRRDMTRIEIVRGHSLLTFTFNMAWADALNARQKYGVTHWAMLHDDVCPEPGWLDLMLDELNASGADILSAAVPIKDGRGLTSTALDGAAGPWVVRRVTMTELYGLPETFAAEDVPWRESGACLLANTGLWVCRFDAPWVERVCFRQQDRVVFTESGEAVAQTNPEDWDFSRQAAALGLTVKVTRKVPLYHEREEWHNRGPWGEHKTDEGYFRCLERHGRAA